MSGAPAPKKLFKILRQLERYGVGRKVTRLNWPRPRDPALLGLSYDPTSYWTITRVKPKPVSPSTSA